MTTHQPQGDDALHTTERLARAIEHHLASPPEGTAPGSIERFATAARGGHYDDYLSPLPEPIMTLVENARALGLEDIALRAINGEFDATLAESRAWYESPAGQKLFHELVQPDPAKAIGDDSVGVWVMSEPTPDRTAYHAVIHLGDDYSRILDAPTAHLHVRKVMEACAAAEYMGAVARQMIDVLKFDEEDGYRTVVRLREFHGRFSYTASGLTFAPGLANGGKPFLRVFGPEGKWWQWRPSDAKLHALGVLECVSAAQWDLAYREYLINREGLEQQHGELMVDRLVTHRRDEDRLFAHDEHPTRDRSSRTAHMRNRGGKKRR